MPAKGKAVPIWAWIVGAVIVITGIFASYRVIQIRERLATVERNLELAKKAVGRAKDASNSEIGQLKRKLKQAKAAQYLTENTEAEPTKQAQISSVAGEASLRLYKLPFDSDVHWRSGPFEVLSAKTLLFLTKCGDVHFVSLSGSQELTTDLSELKIGMGDDLPTLRCDHEYGVVDTLADGDTLFVSYVASDQPHFVRLVVAEYELEEKSLSFRRVLFSTNAYQEVEDGGCQTGGTMALDPSKSGMLFLAVGDFHEPGVRALSRGEGDWIGKVIAIDRSTGVAELYARGLRSPTGGILYDAERNKLWESEHGPRGGDEINLIIKAADYGWPRVTYGTPYLDEWSPSETAYQTHEGYEKPKLVFVPSIGIGRLALYPRTGPIKAWRGDIFFAGMRSRTLYRARPEGDGLAYAEPVMVGYRIRDMHIADDGTFYLKTDDGELLSGGGP